MVLYSFFIFFFYFFAFMRDFKRHAHNNVSPSLSEA